MSTHGRAAGLALGVVALMAVGTTSVRAADPPPLRPERAVPSTGDQWIVELDAPPLARHHGTAPERGEKLDAGSAAAKEYREELAERQQNVLAAVPGVEPALSYRTAFAGFAAKLTDAQVVTLRDRSDVRRVTRERMYRLDAVGGARASTAPGAASLAGSEPELLGLPAGLWQQLGGPRQAGKGVIIGVVDSGIVPEAPSFAARDLEPPDEWYGSCQGGERFPITACNGKLIGARYFRAGQPPGELPSYDYLSPRDAYGHGTHVAASAVGNEDVDPVIGGNDLGVGEIAGVAPAAHLAAYKACWYHGGASCSEVDLLAAVDAAVADGVDVLNLSLGGPIFPGQPKIDPLQLALLAADAAGVFVAVAAGNGGEHPLALGTPAAAPWTTAVGATTSARTFRTTIAAKSGDGASLAFPASGTSPALSETPVVDMRTVEQNPDWPNDPPQECAYGFKPEAVRGKVALCDFSGRTAPDIVDTFLRRAGARGVIFSGPEERAEDMTETLIIPALFAGEHDADRLRELAKRGAATVSWDAATAVARPTDRVAWFSSRGPSPITRDLLRPDVAAPGVGVLSAYAPGKAEWLPAEHFAVLRGTSMAAPQVAGVGALLTQLHPLWSPAAIRSALATTGRPTTDSDGDGAGQRIAAGGGRVDPQAAANVDLVVEPSDEDYERYAEGIDPASMPGDLPPIAPRDLNMPSLSLGEVTDFVEVKRTLTSVASRRTSWTASIEGLDPVAAEAWPARFTLAPGQARELSIGLGVEDEPSASFTDAALVLTRSDNGQRLRLPLAIKYGSRE